MTRVAARPGSGATGRNRDLVHDHTRAACRQRVVAVGFVAVLVFLGVAWAVLARGSADSVGTGALCALAVLATAASVGVGAGPRSAGGLGHRGEAMRRHPGTDELTGLPERQSFLHAAGRLLGGGHRMRAVAPVALLVLDVDGMSDINLALGHELGDRLLATVVRRLRSALPDSALLARVDGDAFAVLLQGVDADEARRVAVTLRAALEPPLLLDSTPVRPDASIGIACSPLHGRTPLELLRRAEQAMHSAKRARSGQAVYLPAPPPVNRARLLLRAEVRQALDKGQIELTYQPKADLRSGRINGVEALVRWRHPRDGVRPPDHFLAEIDRAGLMPRLTVQVLDQALADCARWRAGGAALTVSVNVPASVIIDRAFVGVVRAALARHGLPPSALVVELTEDTLVEARDTARLTLAGLRRFGVRVSLDDYGTGFCSLTYLRDLPADEVKLDRTFMRDLESDPVAAEIVRSTVSLAHALRLRIVAEGVETQRSWEALADWQCDEVQGYFVARPMAGDRVVGWLREWAGRVTARPAPAGELAGVGVVPGAVGGARAVLTTPPSAFGPGVPSGVTALPRSHISPRSVLPVPAVHRAPAPAPAPPAAAVVAASTAVPAAGVGISAGVGMSAGVGISAARWAAGYRVPTNRAAS